MNRVLLAVVVLVTVIAIDSGCGVVRMYKGPRLPWDSVAVLHTPPTTPCYVSRVDGRKLAPYVVEVDLLPGNHTIEVMFNDHPWWGKTLQKSFTVLAGREYRVVPKIDYENKRWSVTVEEEKGASRTQTKNP